MLAPVRVLGDASLRALILDNRGSAVRFTALRLARADLALRLLPGGTRRLLLERLGRVLLEALERTLGNANARAIGRQALGSHLIVEVILAHQHHGQLPMLQSVHARTR